MQKMKAIGLYHPRLSDTPETLFDLEVEKPTASGHDILVNVKAVSVNPVDTKNRIPQAPREHTAHIIGWDAAGIVEAVGSECTLFKPGDQVYYAGDITRTGSNSEYQLVDERIVGRKPANLNFAEAAALPLTTLTAWEGLFDRLGLAPQEAGNRGKSILIIGAAGGVGSIATQLASWAGLTVIGTASRPESIQWAKDHGADHTISHRQPFAPQLKQLGFESVDSIFCLNQISKHWDDIVEVIAPQGKICTIVRFDGLVDLNPLMRKSATVAWELMYTRSTFKTADMIQQHNLLNTAADLIDAGKLQSTLTRRLTPITAANLRAAHALVENGDMIGKVVLEQF